MNFMPDPGPDWQLKDLDFDRDYKRLGLMESIYASNNPDLRKFKAAGGKLLVYQGMNDVPIPPQNIIDYYETAEKTMGGRKETQDFFRLFLIPGMNHCSGGDGAYAIDYLSHLEAWVEQNKAPNKMIAANLKDGPADTGDKFPLDLDSIKFTRPVFPYPVRAKYTGSGDANDASNFIPVEP